MTGLRRLGTSVAIVAALAAALAAPVAASAPASDPAAARFEVRFMETMIDHHTMAIEMAELCPGRAVHQPLLDTCASIISTQSAERSEMETWLGDWYGVTYSPTMRPGDMRMLQQMASMTGSEFEIDFMERMIGHHSKAVVQASTCLRLAEHAELLTTCQNIISSQTAEIRLFQTWLCDWYDVCHYRAGLSQ